MKLLTEYMIQSDFTTDDMSAGYIDEDGSIIYVDEYHGEDSPYRNLGLPEFSSTHLDDICVRIYKEPNNIQYNKLEYIIDRFLNNFNYCKVELANNPLGSSYFYTVYSLYEGACEDSEDEIVGNWTGYKLIQIVKNNINKKSFDSSIDESYRMPKKLYDIKDDQAYWPEDSEDYIWWDSEAKNNSNYASCYKIKLSPKDYLDLTTLNGSDNLKLGDEIGGNPVEKLDIARLNKELRQPIFLIVSFKKDPNIAYVVGHEGRHRAFALMDAGIKTIDVQMKCKEYDTTFDKQHPFDLKDFYLIGQFNKNVRVNVKDAIPMSWENHKKMRPNLTESSNVKLLYHATTLAKSIIILKNNELISTYKCYNKDKEKNKPCSYFTEDLTFAKNICHQYDHPVIFVLNKEKLQNKYNFIKTSDNKKYEQLCETTIKNFDQYIIKILCYPSDVDAFRNFYNLPYEMFSDINGNYKGKLTESLLLEMNRNQLIQKSKKSDSYKDQSKGRNRWERRNKSKIATRVDQYNKIDMNKFFKDDELKVGINVKGETNDYVVTIRYNGALKEIQEQIKRNNNTLEFKCVLIALQRVFNAGNVFVSCSCPDWKYRQAYHATKDGYNSGEPEVRASDITNPGDTKGAGCKHVNLVLGNVDWLMKICSVINNYIHYMKDHFERKYGDLIFPKLFGITYQKAVQLNLFDTDDELSSNPDEIKLSNQYGRDRTRFKSDVRINNMRNFGGSKKEEKEDPNQPKLDLGLTRKFDKK